MDKHTYLSLPNAYKRLSGFIFDKVLTGNELGATIFFMEPNVWTEYMNFIKLQSWTTRAAATYSTPIEIFDIIKPRILKILDNNVTDISKSVKTEKIGRLPDGILPDIRAIPSHVENLIVNRRVACKYDGYCVPTVIQETASAFYDDELPVSFVQLKRLIFERVIAVYIPRPNNNKAAGKLLKHCLKGTRFEANEIYIFHKLYPMSFTNTKEVITANTVLANKYGMEGLLAVRVDVLYTETGAFDEIEVTMYFWKDRQEYLPATVEYYEKEDSGI